MMGDAPVSEIGAREPDARGLSRHIVYLSILSSMRASTLRIALVIWSFLPRVLVRIYITAQADAVSGLRT